MKRINLIFVIALVFSAAFIFSAGAGDAFIPSEEFEALETTEIKLVNEAGDSPVTLNGGEKLTASVKVRNNSEEGIELVLYCVLSENNRVKEIYSYPDTAKANDITPFTKEFTLPEETEGLTLNVMLWDSEENIKNACKIIVEKHSGEVPKTMEELTELPGVGRKTANVVLLNAFGKCEGIAVDTHAKRISQRIGLSKSDDPLKIEQDLLKKIPQKDWHKMNHLFVDHGRATCTARSPKCKECCIESYCKKHI